METFTSFVENGDYGRLNPYCNGRYSWSNVTIQPLTTRLSVLILIIMEDTHGDKKSKYLQSRYLS